MEEVERIASTSKNLNDTYMRRSRISRKVRATGAELQHCTIAVHRVAGLEKGNAYLRDRMYSLENEVNRLQETVERLTSELEKSKAIARKGLL
jgi:hypothetical protein